MARGGEFTRSDSFGDSGIGMLKTTTAPFWGRDVETQGVGETYGSA